LTTTVTVDDEIRRKLKRLAAMLDITQGEVIEKALEQYENRVVGHGAERRVSRRVLQAIREASARVRRSDPEWARISRRIETSAISLEESISEAWGREL